MPWRPRGCGGVVVYRYTFFHLGSRLRRVNNAMPRPLYYRERDSLPIVQEVGWALALVRTSAEDIAAPVLTPPDRTARSESLYRLRLAAVRIFCNLWQSCIVFHWICRYVRCQQITFRHLANVVLGHLLIPSDLTHPAFSFKLSPLVPSAFWSVVFCYRR